MKVRCGGCGKVVQIPGSAPPTGKSCPACGAGLSQHQTETPGVSPPSSSKGHVPTQSKATSVLGLVVVILVLSFFGSLASASRAESTSFWPAVGLLGIVATVAVGLWFQNKSRRDKQ